MILVFGKTGQVATELQRSGDVLALGRDQADLSDPVACAQRIRAFAPRAVINAAASTAVDKADEDEERFWASQGNNNAGRSAAPAPAQKKELTAKEVALQRRRKTKYKGAQHHQRDRAARKV